MDRTSNVIKEYAGNLTGKWERLMSAYGDLLNSFVQRPIDEGENPEDFAKYFLDDQAAIPTVVRDAYRSINNDVSSLEKRSALGLHPLYSDFVRKRGGNIIAYCRAYEDIISKLLTEEDVYSLPLATGCAEFNYHSAGFGLDCFAIFASETEAWSDMEIQGEALWFFDRIQAATRSVQAIFARSVKNVRFHGKPVQVENLVRRTSDQVAKDFQLSTL